MNLAGRQRLRLRLRDLAAAGAFSAVGLSGAVPAWVSALFIAALVPALLGYRPMARIRSWAVLVLLAVALVLFGLAFRGVMDLVVAAVSFASLVTAHRMCSTPDASTDRQVLLASLLLISGAAALAGEFWYVACLLVFGVFACLSLGLSVLEGPSERDEDLPLDLALKQIGVGVAFALVGGVAFFVLFPRLSWNVASRGATPPVVGATAGMTDRVRLGGGGTIKTSARVVLRATLEPDPGRERLERYWVGRHFDVFDGREWRGAGVAQPPAPIVFLGPVGSGRLVQRIELLPAYESRTLVGLERPLSFGSAVALTTAGSSSTSLVQVRGEEVHFASDANAYRYAASSTEEKQATEPLDEPQRQRALAVPPTLDPRVRELAARVAGGEDDPLATGRRLERWLTRNLEYTLELPGDVDDPLVDFLFARKAGHCEHFATALAVMLRTRGIPARLVGGFFGGERIGERYVLRAGDAHAWVEAWVDGQGWVRFDATPETGRGGQPPALLSRLVNGYERLEELWRSRVIDYSLIDQIAFVRGLIRPPTAREVTAEAPEAQGARPLPLRRLAGAIAAGLVTLALWRRLARRREQRAHVAASFLAEVERRLDAAHLARAGDERLEELSRRLTAAGHPAAAALAQATRRYLEARFGRRPLAKAERRSLLRALDHQLAGGDASPGQRPPS